MKALYGLTEFVVRVYLHLLCQASLPKLEPTVHVAIDRPTTGSVLQLQLCSERTSYTYTSVLLPCNLGICGMHESHPVTRLVWPCMAPVDTSDQAILFHNFVHMTSHFTPFHTSSSSGRVHATGELICRYMYVHASIYSCMYTCTYICTCMCIL